MKSLSFAASKNELDTAFDRVLALKPSIVFAFGAPSLLADQYVVEKIKERLSGTALIGCSTAGEIAGDGSYRDSLALMAIRFDRTGIRVVSEPLTAADKSFDAGQRLAEQLKATDLAAVFVLAPGTNVNGSSLVEGLTSCLGRAIPLVGGLAADELVFKKTYTVCGTEVFSDRLVAVGFYGEALALSCGSEGGWRPFGPARRVTKVDGHILYEIDGLPALQLYRQYLGERARALPASGLSYPFAILREDRTTSGLIRSALAVDQEREALILAGSVPPEGRICLMHADTDALTQGAAQAAAEALRTHPGPEANGCALAISFIGRKVVYGIDPEEEIEAVVDSFLPGTPIAGFYSYGEIATNLGKKQTAFHNQTMTIVYITEREAA